MALTRLGLNQPVNLTSNVTGTLPVANGGTNLSSGFINGTTNVGKIAQVVQTIKTPATNSTSGSSFVSPSGASVSITPSATSSKVLVSVQGGGTVATDSASGYFTIYRDSTNLGDSTKGFQRQYNDERTDQPLSMQYLDSPNTTSATTYQVYYRANHNTIYMHDSDSGNLIITAMEVLA